MKGFNPIIRQRVAPVDLETVANTYRELEQGHQRSVQLTSQLQTAMAQLPLNEAEDEWRQNKIQEIRNTLDNNLNYGNAAGAYDDLVRVQGDITSDPGLIGRIRAQQDYTTYIDNLNKRQDLSEYHKNYYRANTKYNYRDIVNDKGQVIGGTKWEPNEQPVSSVDLNKIYNEALKYVSPDKGQYDKTVFINPETGAISSTYSPDVSMARYNTVTGKYEILSPEKLRAAVDAAIKANPAIRASLEQDYKIDKWYHNQDPNVANDVIDAKGYVKSFNQYVDDKIDPFIRAKQYRNIFTSTDYNDSIINEIAKNNLASKAKSNAGDNEYVNGFSNTLLAKGPKYRHTINPEQEANRNIRERGSYYANDLNNKYQNLNIPTFDENTTEASLSDFITRNNISGEAVFDIYRSFDKFKNDTYKDRITRKNILGDVEDPKKIAALDFYTQLNSGIIDDIKSTDSDELKYYKQYNANLTNQIFGKNSSGISLELKDERMFDSFKRRLGGLYDTFNIKKYAGKNGSVRLVLTADNKDGLYKFIDAGNYAVRDNRIFGGIFSNKWGSINRVDEDGNDISVTNTTNIYTGMSPFTNISITGNVKYINSLYNKLNKELLKEQEDILPEGGDLVVDTEVSNYANPEQFKRDILYQTTEKSSDAKLEKDRRDDINDRLSNLFLNNPELAISGKYYKIDDDGTIIEMDSKDIKDLRKLQHTTNPKDITAQLIWLPGEKYKTKFTIRKDDGKTQEYILLEGIDDPSLTAVNNSVESNSRVLRDRLNYNFEAIPIYTLSGRYGLVKDKTTNRIVMYDNNEMKIEDDVSEDRIKAYTDWTAVLDKINSGSYSESDKNAISKAYDNLLIAEGINNPDDRFLLIKQFIENL